MDQCSVMKYSHTPSTETPPLLQMSPAAEGLRPMERSVSFIVTRRMRPCPERRSSCLCTVRWSGGL